MPESTNLPIEEVLPRLQTALSEYPNAVLVAPPGAGKSTVVPLALLGQPWIKGKKILLLEPRRLAARAVAARMAKTLGEQVGATVGYRMRLDTRVGPATRIEVVTEGVLTRMLQEDPALEGVAAVLFDEFHERSLHADLGLALCLQAQDTVAPQLRLLVMSATIDAAAVASTMGNAPVIAAEGRMFPVAVHYVARGLPVLPQGRTFSPREIEPVAAAVRAILDKTEGDVLVFLPGTPEIHRLRGLLEPVMRASEVEIHPLYGDLELAAQQHVLDPPAAGRRKLILATNIAETSLTIPGVRVVIDTGLERRSLFDPSTGMARLVTTRISEASATQRAGRAGRTSAGSAWRLWGEGAQTTLAPQTPPEIANADLAPMMLELALWGVSDPRELRWLDLPPEATVAQARDLLKRLEALDDKGRATRVGRNMAATGLHPRLAHMLVRARGTPDENLAAQLAALLTERDLLRAASDPDLRSRMEILRGEARGMDPGAVARVRELARRYGARGAIAATDDARAGQLLAWGWPDRVAQRRPAGAGGQRYLLANGRGAQIPQVSTLANAPYLVALDLDDADGAEARIRLAAPLTLAQLEEALGNQVTEGVETAADAKGALRSRRIRRLGALVLAEQRVETDPQAKLAALVQQLEATGLAALPWNAASRRLLARLRFVAAQMAARKAGAAADFPDFDDAALCAQPDWLIPWLDGCNSLGQLPEQRLIEALSSRLTHAQRVMLDSWAPAHVVVPTGSRIAVDYEDESAPCIEVRMQEVFGLADTPRIANGTVAITLKLLSPARRPMQITRDLAGFWRGSYAEVRRDMRGRYPRHYWPENPLEAEAVRGPKPRRR